MMICALPFSYVALKMGAPAYFVFIIIFCVNLTQMFWGWMIVHRYVTFRYSSLIKKVYVPTICITLISIVIPLLLTHLMEQGWTRFVILGLLTELVLLSSVYMIALSKEERVMVHSFIRNKILKK